MHEQEVLFLYNRFNFNYIYIYIYIYITIWYTWFIHRSYCNCFINWFSQSRRLFNMMSHPLVRCGLTCGVVCVGQTESKHVSSSFNEAIAFFFCRATQGDLLICLIMHATPLTSSKSWFLYRCARIQYNNDMRKRERVHVSHTQKCRMHVCRTRCHLGNPVNDPCGRMVQVCSLHLPNFVLD
jgi:hypothetical protein